MTNSFVVRFTKWLNRERIIILLLLGGGIGAGTYFYLVDRLGWQSSGLIAAGSTCLAILVVLNTIAKFSLAASQERANDIQEKILADQQERTRDQKTRTNMFSRLIHLLEQEAKKMAAMDLPPPQFCSKYEVHRALLLFGLSFGRDTDIQIEMPYNEPQAILNLRCTNIDGSYHCLVSLKLLRISPSQADLDQVTVIIWRQSDSERRIRQIEVSEGSDEVLVDIANFMPLRNPEDSYCLRFWPNTYVRVAENSQLA